LNAPNIYYKKYLDQINLINQFLYNEIKTEKGWKNLKNYQDKILLYMNSLIFIGQKYLDSLIISSNNIVAFYNKFSIVSYSLLASSLVFIILGIIFTYSSYNRIFLSFILKYIFYIFNKNK